MRHVSCLYCHVLSLGVHDVLDYADVVGLYTHKVGHRTGRLYGS